ncbi:MAG: hypothetical protein ACK40M_02900 [Flavobacteriales bacterium]
MKKLALLLVCSLSYSGTNELFAQESGGNGNYMTVIEVGLPRSLVRTNRLSENPRPADTVIAVPPMTYSNVPSQAKTEFTPDKLTAANVFPKQALPKLYRFYFRGGVGSYASPLAELYVNDIYNKKGSWGAHLKHFSSNSGIDDLGFSGFSDNMANVYGKLYLNKLEIGGDFSYKRNVVHYYGFNPDSFPEYKERDTIRQRFQYFGANAYIAKFKPDSNKINHRENIGFYHFNDRYGANENFFTVTSAMNKRMGREVYRLDMNIRYNGFLPTSNSYGCLTCLSEPQTATQQDNFIGELNPHIVSKGKNWIAKAGLKVSMDVYSGTSYFYFYPDAEFRYSLFNDIFVPYAGIDGGIQRNSYKTLTDENPFLMTFQQDLRNTVRKINVYGGIRGTWSSTLSFNAKVGYTALKDQVMFVTDTTFSPQARFGLVYDDGGLLTMSGQLSYQQREKIKVILRGEYFRYKLENEAYAWNIPDLKVTLSGVYDLYDKIIVRADVFFVGQRYGRSLMAVDGGEQLEGQNIWAYRLKPFVDANLGVEYRYTKRVSAFLNVNNIAASRYQYWYKYPVQSINVMGGFTVSC